MAILHTTLLLDPATGDLCLDASGNIALASAPYSIAQDVAAQLQSFLGECWYDTSQGLPYWQKILGGLPPASYVKAQIEAQALLVPDVESAVATISGITKERGVVGQALITDTDGNPAKISLNGNSVTVSS